MSTPADHWNQRYDRGDFFYGREPNDWLVAQVDQLRGDVLCLAEGEGRNGVFLAGRGCRVSAVDLSRVGLAKAQALAAEAGVSIATEVGDLATYDLGVARWDGIVSIWCHLPTALRAEVHRRVVAALRPGGVFVLEAYTPRQLEFRTGGPPDVNLLMTLAALRTELAGLEIAIGQEVEREIHEGKGHSGPSAVVQLLARKP